MLIRLHYNELCHHGIKGQKWGVRRYQNKGGHLTKEGKQKLKEKYRSIGREEKRLRDKLYKNSEEYTNAKKKADEADFIAKKYGLDADDGGGGNTSKYSSETLAKAGQRYMELWDEYEYHDSLAKKEGTKKAKEFMRDKYGQTYNDAVRYNERTEALTTLFVTAAIAIPVAYITAGAVKYS